MVEPVTSRLTATPRARFAELEQAGRVLAAVRSGQQRAAGGLWGGSAALLLATLVERRPGPLLVVCADDEHAATLEADLHSFSDRPITRLDAQVRDVQGESEPSSTQQRLAALLTISENDAFTAIASLAALIDPVPRPAALRGGDLVLRAGAPLQQAALLAKAEAAGLRRVPVVLGPGEISVRGDIVDVFALGAPDALRLELFDDVLESVRRFEPSTQRSLAVLEQVTLPLGSTDTRDAGAAGHAIEHLGRPDLLVVQVEPLRIDEQRAAITLHRDDGAARLAAFADSIARIPRLDVSSLPSHDLDFKVLSAGSATGCGEADPLGRLNGIRGVKKGAVRILCRNEDERERLARIFARKDVDLAAEHVQLAVGALSRGFRIPDLSLTVISNVEFAGAGQSTRVRERPVLPTKALASFFELGPGDTVVHAAHGIAQFEGIERVERGAAVEDHLRLCFANDVRLLVPSSKIHLIQKYVGAGSDVAPKLDRLGGRGFQKRKAEVCEALYDLAAELLDLMAQRARVQREPYPADPLEDELLDAFPFTDTPDQARAWAEIKADLEDAGISDRLLCGDVGFGKTEVAMRAACKVAIHGRQVAVLVPTTVLAEQHGETFERRLGPLGLRTEVLSRYRTGKRRTEILAAMARGAVDVVIGTHRLLSDDVEIPGLGLLIIDEEQRFGVRHKEHLKRLRLEIDVLSLSATPIPRTLHASMLGVRGISTLSTPPPGRQDVDTRVLFWDPVVLRDALQRELAREGQVFVIHNRIDTLEHTAQTVRELAPGARVAIGHGKMTATEMEKTVRRFVAGDFDVLVSTTIVENGLDLPRANTILIERADCFGLAELHQLRGRVGRSDRQAYCFLLLDRANPPRDDARKRLKALEEFSHLGAGFAVAMKDLEIRGAGNLLGPQQSGHIAAVGYEMYCELLRGAIDAAQRAETLAPMVAEVDVDVQVEAYLPDALAQDPKERLELLRELDGAVHVDAALECLRSLTDRFGTLPAPVTNLLCVFLLKHALIDHAVVGLQFTGEDRVIVRTPPGEPPGGAWLDAFADVRQVEAGKTHLVLPRRRGRSPWTGDAVLALLLRALLGPAAAEKMRQSCQRAQRPRRERRSRQS